MPCRSGDLPFSALRMEEMQKELKNLKTEAKRVLLFEPLWEKNRHTGLAPLKRTLIEIQGI